MATVFVPYEKPIRLGTAARCGECDGSLMAIGETQWNGSRVKYVWRHVNGSEQCPPRYATPIDPDIAARLVRISLAARSGIQESLRMALEAPLRAEKGSEQ